MELTENQLLNYALENGMIDLDTIQTKIEMNERKKYLEQHEFTKWKGSDGKYHTYVPDIMNERGRKEIKRSSIESLDDAIIKHYKEQEEVIRVKEVFYMWLKSKLDYGEIEKQTYDRYENVFVKYLKDSELSRVQFKYITEDELEDFIKKTIHEQKLTAKAWGNLRIVINGMFRYAKKKGYTKISITNFMGDLDISNRAFQKKIMRDEEQVFKDSEIDKIMSWIVERDFSIINLGIILAFQTGLRAGELAALKYSDLDGKILNVTKTEIRYKDEQGRYVFEIRDFTKGKDGARQVVLTDSALKTFKQAFRANPFGEYLFMDNGERIKGKSFTVKLEKICRYVGILPRSLHKARKTYGTKLLNAGVPEKLIQKQMGHTDIRTTKGFYYYNNMDIEQAKEILNSAVG